jgi:YD repeat-containing protein
MSRRPFKTWLFAATSGVALAAGAAQAQSISQPTPPEHYTLDARGVDLVSGHFNFQTTEVMIGQPGGGGLALTRGRTQLNWRDSNQGSIEINGSTYTVASGMGAEVFTLSGGTFTPKSNNGSTLTQSGATYTFTTSTGTVLRYTTAYCFTSTGAACTNKAALYEIVTPNGETTSYHYVTQSYLRSVDSNGNSVLGTVVRLQSITNNRGYQLHYVYKSNTMSGAGSLNTKVGNWLAVASVTGVNNAIDYCAPTAVSCSYTRTWPSIAYTSTVGGPITAATDQSGRVTQYIYGPSSNLTGIRYPGSTTNDITVDESGVAGRVSTLTDATGTWNYSYLDGDTNRTVTTTGPSGEEVTVLSNTVIGQPIQITTRTSVSTTSTTYFAYDAQGRLTRTTSPEGDYVEQTLDARGNVTQVTATPKPGSGLSPITSSSTFDATCTNPVICNLPTATTDTAGNVTDYTWDAVHGGPLTITAPAPSAGADRPQTRITYAAQTAYYKNSSGVITAAETSVTLPTVVSACATGTSCPSGANEVRTTIGYGSAGVANNLLPASISQGSGASPSMAVTAMTYTPDGDVETVDGPLPQSGDIIRYRYDNARQMVGLVGPDPDGVDAGLNLAQRMTYNPRGQVTLSETGTTPGYTDANWASFNPLVRSATIYDDRGRPLVSSQQSGAGTTVGVQQVSYDASGRPDCLVVRMNPAAWGSLPTSACTATTAGSDGPDRITRMTYDAASRPLTETSAYGVTGVTATTSVTYGPNGQIVSLTDGNGNVSTQDYDGFNRPTVLHYPNPSTSDYEQVNYDVYGRMVSRRDRAGLTTTLALDNLGRATLVDAPSGMDVVYTYDNLGRVLTTAGGGQTLTNVWDPLSRLTSETGPLGAMSYQYDERGAMTRITWPDTFYAQYDRNVQGSVTKIRENGATSGPAVLATYTYNNLGQPVGIARGDTTNTTYGYDAAGRMTSLSHDMAGSGSDVAFGYTWNPAGQIASRTVSNGVYVYAPNTGSTTYVNNSLNQVTSAGGSSVTYDANQNTATALGSSYGYDAANRLTSATIGGTGYAFAYDPQGRLASGSDARFQYVGIQLVGEYNGSGVLTTRHVPGPGLDQR